MTVETHKGILQEREGTRISRSDCHIALVPSLGLGDSLIYLVVANNLARAGYRVTMLSNHLAHFTDWLPNFAVLPFPKPEETQCLAEDYDLVLSDCGSIVVGIDQEPLQLAKQYVFVGTLRVNPICIQDHSARVEQRCGPEKAALPRPLSGCAGPLRVIDDPCVTMVDQAVAFCRTTLDLEQASCDPGFVIPEDPSRAVILSVSCCIRPPTTGRKTGRPASTCVLPIASRGRAMTRSSSFLRRSGPNGANTRGMRF